MAGIIDLFENTLRRPVDYTKLYDDIREAIDTVHRDNSLKRVIRQDIARYIFKDPELGPALHRLRSGGKKLFLLTNSLWDYTNAVMSYLLDGVLPEYPSWRNYFDFVITGGRQAGLLRRGTALLRDRRLHRREPRRGPGQPRSSAGRSTRAATWPTSSA